MHIIIGGAFNGKGRYIRTVLSEDLVHYINLQQLGSCQIHYDVLVISEIESYVENQLTTSSDELVLAQQIFEKLVAIDHVLPTVYIILEDIGRGIVPIDIKQRQLRDVQGRLNQMLFQYAQHITRLWYGIPQQIK
ncbi:bifunctional adenosylcobinamide kinase/adenosylcobinamide-phosphate guanylyltransferase [Kurthia sibirica]|uniref:Uncharacterized protein n=1 Tax=Kurthia sibirica TaxID=202750 RepID=A0A2U3AL14_9BACL|nr:bifunctional adenosylcobinamide kinase/adenosylcobinamide-phosphate guanylyltransferase [Kurthia sibirica]PWI25223.1 hypothetical protein DEX24_09410 [Kurthia sibirica]GEK33228.1 hypothetical protein KSI01_07610 [Kurthia sibirica]